MKPPLDTAGILTAEVVAHATFVYGSWWSIQPYAAGLEDVIVSPPRLLLLNNGVDEFSVSRMDLRFREMGLDVDYRWAYQGEFPDDLSEYAGAFLSGSPHGAYESIPWINREHDVIVELARRNVPMLGVCFGSQILASALIGRDQVFRRSNCEVGFLPLRLSAAASGDALLGSCGDFLTMFVWHNDEVRSEHPDIVVLASTDTCPNQIWRHRTLPVWGIQGHPELTRDQAVALVKQKRERLEKDGADVAELISAADEAAEAKVCFTNFVKVVRSMEVAMVGSST